MSWRAIGGCGRCGWRGERTRGGDGLRAAPTFRFSRIGPQGKKLPDAFLRKVALAMTGSANRDGKIPAGFTYPGQFVDHDLTFDKTLVAFGDQVSPADLVQGRSPTLDLDSLYGAGPLVEASVHSIVRSPEFRPSLGPVDGRFRMSDLLVFAFENKESLLAPLGD